jgi:hypothetical protein
VKNIIKILLFLILLNGSLYAQINDLEKPSAFNKCEITFNDGKVEHGFIAFFLEPFTSDFEDAIGHSLERVLNLDDNDFEFKTSISDRPINMTQKNIQQIKVYYENNYVKTYKLMHVKKILEDGTIQASSKKAWLPVSKEDVISLYQKNIYREYKKYNKKTDDFITVKRKKYITITYLSNEKQNIAFEIYDLNQLRLSKPKLDDKYVAKVLQYIFQDCPDFLNKIVKDKRWDYESFMDNHEDYDTQIKLIQKSKLSKTEKFNQIDVLELKKEAQPFLKLIEAYKLNCNQ